MQREGRKLGAMATTFEDIARKLQRNEIVRWEVDPRWQVAGDPNTAVTFYDRNGDWYLLKVRYDSRTNQIFPPLINWDESCQIFNSDRLHDIISSYRSIPDYTRVTSFPTNLDPTILNQTFQLVDSFIPNRYSYYLRQVPTNMDEECALIREWSNETTKLQYLIIKNATFSHKGYCIIFGATNSFLIVGNDDDYPFAISPHFKYFAEHGIVEEEIDLPVLSLDQVKYLLKRKAIEYVFK